MNWTKIASISISIGVGLALTACNAAPERPVVRLETTEGSIDIRVHTDTAPISSADFLRYVDGGLYDGQGFYRVVRADNDPREMGMSLIQGGRLDAEMIGDPISHELTTDTGLSNVTGTVSIARDAPGTGSAAYFFINLDDNSFLDTGGARNLDGQGYATFGTVISGLDIGRKIQAKRSDGASDAEVTNGQILSEPVLIKRAYRR